MDLAVNRRQISAKSDVGIGRLYAFRLMRLRLPDGQVRSHFLLAGDSLCGSREACLEAWFRLVESVLQAMVPAAVGSCVARPIRRHLVMLKG